MAPYHVDLRSPPSGHAVPPLLTAFGQWLSGQQHGSVGWFDALVAEQIPAGWHDRAAARLQAAGFSFLNLPDGSLLALLETGLGAAPPAVVLLGSGEARTVATSLEQFLHRLAHEATGINELDDAEASSGRGALRDWVRAQNLTVPVAPDFDFEAWLDGQATPVVLPSTLFDVGPLPASAAEFPVDFKELANLIGRRSDDPVLAEWAARHGHSSLPRVHSKRALAEEVRCKDVTLWLTHSDHERFPVVPVSPYLVMLYVAQISFTKNYAPLPFGLTWEADAKAVEQKLGPPVLHEFGKGERKRVIPTWTVPLHPGRTELSVEIKKNGLTMSFLISSK